MAVKTYNYPLRFANKSQKNKVKQLALKRRNSINGFLLTLIDAAIQDDFDEGVTKRIEENWRKAPR